MRVKCIARTHAKPLAALKERASAPNDGKALTDPRACVRAPYLFYLLAPTQSKRVILVY